MGVIFGRIELCGRRLDRDQFLSAFGSLRALGPGGSDYWVDDQVGAGAHLLHVAPAANFEGPLEPRRDIIVAADAILDNRDDLAAALGIDALQLATMSDTELIQQSFLRWGSDCVGRLEGDFAFAAINRTTKEVFLARDHIGSRPLFWTLRGGVFVFSTGIAGIVAFNDWPWKIDRRVVAEYLLCPLIPVSKPFFQHIHAVPPGGFLTLKNETVTITKWWRPSTIARPAGDIGDVVSGCKEALERAVSKRVNTNGLVGSHLSGGVDSLGVTVTAARALRSRSRSLSRAYTWSPPISTHYPEEGAQDERRRIKRIAEREGISVEIGALDGAAFLSFLQRPLEFEGDTGLVDEIPILQAIQRDGVRVVLSGWGGDEAFSAHGYGYAAYLTLRGKLSAVREFARHSSVSRKRLDLLLPFVWASVFHPLLPHRLGRLVHPNRRHIQSKSFLSPAVLREFRDLLDERRPILHFGPNPNENLYRHVTAGHLTARMESWAIRSAQHGFQYRYPLTDRRLLEFLFSTAPNHIFLNNCPRGLARAVLADYGASDARKQDISHERLRRDARSEAWRALAQKVADGEFAGQCDWLDMGAFRFRALHPADQSQINNVLQFAELFAAGRIWYLFHRAARNGWL